MCQIEHTCLVVNQSLPFNVAKVQAGDYREWPRFVGRGCRVRWSNWSGHRDDRCAAQWDVSYRGNGVKHQPARLTYVSVMSSTELSFVCRSECLILIQYIVIVVKVYYPYSGRFSLRITCQESFGLDCGCKPRNDRFAHYTCNNSTGDKICLQGHHVNSSIIDTKFSTRNRMMQRMILNVSTVRVS